MLLEYLRISFKYLISNKLRSILTVSSLIVGLVTLSIVTSVLNNIFFQLEESLEVIDSNIISIRKISSSVSLDRQWWQNRSVKNFNYSDYEDIKKYLKGDGNTAATAQTSLSILSRDKYVDNITIKGVTDQYFEIHDFEFSAGRPFSYIEYSEKYNSVIIGSELANIFFDDISAINKTLKISGVEFRIIGVLSKKEGLPISGDINNRVFIPLKSFEKYVDLVNGIEIIVKYNSLDRKENKISDLTGFIRALRNLNPLLDNDFVIEEDTFFKENIARLKWGAIIIGSLIISVTLSVGLITVLNIFFYSINERRFEIGIMMAVGAKPKDIKGQVLVESCLICVFGGIISLIISYLIVQVTDNSLGAKYDFSVIIICLLSSVLVGILSAYAPASKAANLDPIESLNRF